MYCVLAYLRDIHIQLGILQELNSRELSRVHTWRKQINQTREDIFDKCRFN